MIQQGRRQNAKGIRKGTEVIASSLLPLAFCLVCAPAAAQTARNPFADLFGRAPGQGSTERTSVHVRTTAGVQMGQTLRADFEQQDVVPEGLAAGGDATLAAELVRERVQFVGQTRYSYQEFRKAPAFGAPAFDAGGRVNFDVTTRFSLQGGAQYMRSPFFRMLWLPPQIYGSSFPAAADGTAILLTRNDTTEANGGFIWELGPRTSFSASGSARQTRFEGMPDHDFNTVNARGMLRRQISRSLGLHAGYSREELRTVPVATTPAMAAPETVAIETVAPNRPSEVFVNEIIDVGVDFAKSFSMGRRTTFAFGTETSFVRHEHTGRQFRLNGSATFERRFLRTWVTQLAALRATEFVPGFKAPLFTERGKAEIAGYLTKRLLLNAGGEGGRGEVGLGIGGREVAPGEVRKVTTYSGNASLTFGLTRHVGVFTQYVYYYYQMPRDPRALVTVQHLSRQAVSIGVKTWISLIDKVQVPRDPR